MNPPYSWCSSQSSNASSACFLLWIEQLLICWIFSNYSWICGKLPCSNSNNYASDSDLGWIYCGGDRSCMKFSYLQCWWPWYTIKWSSCCTKHNFYSTLISVEFIFYGENTTIICSDANTCNVECYNNACDNLNLTCAGASCILTVKIIMINNVQVAMIWMVSLDNLFAVQQI